MPASTIACQWVTGTRRIRASAVVGSDGGAGVGSGRALGSGSGTVGSDGAGGSGVEGEGGSLAAEDSPDAGPGAVSAPVSYTHLTLPTTPYV